MKKHSKIISTLLLGGLVICITPSHANAQQGSQNNRVQLLDVDTDGDGNVSAAESNAYMQKLAIERAKEMQRQKAEREAAERTQIQPKTRSSISPADLNKDGTVSEKEKSAYFAWLKSKTATPKKPVQNPYADPDANTAMPAFMQQKADKRIKDMKALDLNGDGVLQQNELNKSTSTKFMSADTNKDGILSQSELNASIEKIKSVNSDNGERIAKERANRVKTRFKNGDSNDDGVVTWKEYQELSSEYQNFDRNGDGKISKDEFRSDGEKQPSSYFRE